ncbi:MAG: SUMF1/EgtB/PvdO family nonheme iron enzyme [Parvularculaceae bacterium]
MTDIFIDSAKDDSDIARRVVAALESEGFSVASGAEKGARGRRDEDAAATLVLWSSSSVKSHRIRRKSRAGARNRALIPAIIEDVDPPKGFRRFKTADLRNWRGDRRDPNWLLLLSEIRQCVEQADGAPAMRFRPAAEARNEDAGEAGPAAPKKIAGRRTAAIAGAFSIIAALLLAGYFAFPTLLKGSGQADAPVSVKESHAEEISADAGIDDNDATELEVFTPDGLSIDADADEYGPAADDEAQMLGFSAPETSEAEAAATSESAAAAVDVERVESLSGAAEAGAPEEEAKDAPPPEDADENADAIPAPGESFRDCAFCPEMIVIPSGAFSMGSPETEASRDLTEGPTVGVTIEKPFAIGRYEVTFDEWDACVAAGGCDQYGAPDPGWGRGSRPAVNVSWRDARAYAAWLSEKTGQTYRLPSEAEWEYVARAGGDAPFSFGEALAPDQANYDAAFPYAGAPEGASPGGTLPAGSFAANPFGVYDMHGNVWEWVADCWRPDHRGASVFGAPRGGDCISRVLKGGAWNTGGWRLRAAHRIEGFATRRDYDNGFRLVRELD